MAERRMLRNGHAHLQRYIKLLRCIPASGCTLSERIKRDGLQPRSDLGWLSNTYCTNASGDQPLCEIVSGRVGSSTSENGAE